MSWLAGLGAFGPGFVKGVGTGMELYDQYTDMQGNAIAGQVLPELRMAGMAGMGTMTQQAPTGAASMLSPTPMSQGVPPPAQTPPAPPQGPPQAPPQVAGAGGMLGGMAGSRPGERIGVGPPPAPPAPPAASSPQVAGMQPGPAAPAGANVRTAQVQPDPDQQQLIQSGQGTPYEIQRWDGGRGPGWMTPQELATRIEVAAPNASAAAKWKAFKQGMTLLNQSGQTQFSRIMQMMQYEQRERGMTETRRLHEQTQSRADERLRMQERSQLRNSPYVRGEEKQVTQAKTNLTNTELRMDKIKGHLDALMPIAEKVGITGNMAIDTWLQQARAKLGWTDPVYMQYKTMLANLQSEIAAMSQQTLGSLTVSAREDARQLASGVLTPTILKSVGAAVAIEAKVTKQATKDIVSRHQKNIQSYMDSGGQIPEDEEPADAAAPAAPAAGGDTGGWH